jgi:hypothetical protein
MVGLCQKAPPPRRYFDWHVLAFPLEISMIHVAVPRLRPFPSLRIARTQKPGIEKVGKSISLVGKMFPMERIFLYHFLSLYKNLVDFPRIWRLGPWVRVYLSALKKRLTFQCFPFPFASGKWVLYTSNMHGDWPNPALDRDGQGLAARECVGAGFKPQPSENCRADHGAQPAAYERYRAHARPSQDVYDAKGGIAAARVRA